jgi:hypothetical protein
MGIFNKKNSRFKNIQSLLYTPRHAYLVQVRRDQIVVVILGERDRYNPMANLGEKASVKNAMAGWPVDTITSRILVPLPAVLSQNVAVPLAPEVLTIIPVSWPFPV